MAPDNQTVLLTGRATTQPSDGPSDWRVLVAGFEFQAVKGHEPNAFHRWMQGWALGVKWIRSDGSR